MSTIKYKNNHYANLILQNDKSNKFCVDCGKANPTHVSINNGVTLCQDCTDIHLFLGLSISYIRLLYGKWDHYLYKYFLFGGNDNFIKSMKLLSNNNSFNSIDIFHKYTCNTAMCYRKCLKAKVMNEKHIDVSKYIDEFNVEGYCYYDHETFNEFVEYQVDNKGMIGKVMGNVGKLFNGFGKTIGVIKRQAVVKKGEIKQVISKIPKLFKKGSKVKKKEKIKEKKGKRRKTGKDVNESDEENDEN